VVVVAVVVVRQTAARQSLIKATQAATVLATAKVAVAAVAAAAQAQTVVMPTAETAGQASTSRHGWGSQAAPHSEAAVAAAAHRTPVQAVGQVALAAQVAAVLAHLQQVR
jgi:hypothetical protein